MYISQGAASFQQIVENNSTKEEEEIIYMMASSERDWCDLPPELVHLISRKLLDLRYFIRCRAVCKHWFSSILLSDPPRQQLPWLIEYGKEFPDATPLKQELRFHSFVTGETGSIPIQKTHRGKAYHRPGHSYLLVVDRKVMSLLNPLTDRVISLPPLPSSFSTMWPVFGGEDPSRNWLWHIVLYSNRGSWQCATYHPNKTGWKYVDNSLCRTCYWLGMLFTTVGGSSTLVFDAASGKKLYTIPRPKDEPFDSVSSYIVESCGAILRVSRDIRHGDVESSIVRIYALDFGGGRKQPCWVRVIDIGDRIVFLDHRNGFSARATDGLKGNCIYFIVENAGPIFGYCIGSKLWRYDIGTGKFERLPCPFERCTWFVPNLC